MPPAGAQFGFCPFSQRQPTFLPVEFVSLPPPSSWLILEKTFFPDRATWIQKVEKAIQQIRKGDLQKIVLARQCHLKLAEPIDPFALLSSLKQKAPHAYHFCLAFEEGAFLGASPEQLYSRKDQQLFSEALAGTRPRGHTAEEDKFLSNELLGSAKDLCEFRPVQTHLQSALAPLCITPLNFSPLEVYQTPNVQHLYSFCEATLDPHATDGQIFSRLHPTPALCGTPTVAALKAIEELEPFSRGLYGGAIGWQSPDASEWAVAIRSCFVQGDRVTLYTGTGIVANSDPEKEWEELNQKLRLYDGILDHRSAHSTRC